MYLHLYESRLFESSLLAFARPQVHIVEVIKTFASESFYENEQLEEASHQALRWGHSDTLV